MKSPNQKPPTTSKLASPKPARRTQPDAPLSVAPGDLHARIETRAREIYEQRIHRGELDDWLQAEQEVLHQKPLKPKKLSAKSEALKGGSRT